jgi:hypothetical protein
MNFEDYVSVDDSQKSIYRKKIFYNKDFNKEFVEQELLHKTVNELNTSMRKL